MMDKDLLESETEMIDQKETKEIEIEKEFDAIVNSCSCPIYNNFWYKLMITGLYWWSFFGAGLGVAAISITIVDYRKFLNKSLTVSTSTVSLIFMIRGAGLILCGFLSGRISDIAKRASKWYHLNLHQVSAFAVFCLNFPLLILPLIPYWFLSLPIHSILGVGGNTLLISTALLPKFVWKKDNISASVIQGTQFSFAFGAFLYPLLIGSTIFSDSVTNTSMGERHQLNLIIIFYFCFTVSCFPLILCCFPPPRIPKSSKTSSSLDSSSPSSFMKKIIQKVTCQKDRKMIENLFFHHHQQQQEETFKDFSFVQKIHFFFKEHKQFDVFRLKLMISIGFCMILVNGLCMSFQNLLFLYCEERGFSKAEASYSQTVYFLCFSIARMVAVFVFLFANAKHLIFVYMSGAILTIAFLNIFRSNDLVLWICIGCAALFNSPLFGSLIILPHNFGIQPTGLEQAIVLTSSGIGQFLPSGISGLMEIHNDFFLVSILVLAIFMLVAYYYVYCYGTILQEFRKKEQQKQQQEEGKEIEIEMKDL